MSTKTKKDTIVEAADGDSSDLDVNEKQRAKVERRYARIEKATMERAMAQVQHTAKDYKSGGLSSNTFMLGQINIALLWFWLGYSPQTYWILVMAKSFLYLGYIWKTRLKKQTDLFYMAEFCWVTCHVQLIFLFLAFISVCGVQWEWLKQEAAYSRTAFYAFWGLANGPFAFAVVALRNALVLHDLPNLASAFIHLTPVSLSWTFRWFANDIRKQYPGVFNLPDPDQGANETFLDIFGPAMAFYSLWWVVYTFGYMFFVGRYQGRPWHKYDTAYHQQMQSMPGPAKSLGYDPSTPESRARMLPLVIYMLLHGTVICGLVALSYLLWFSFWAHTFFAACLFCSCTFHGSVRYYKMMTIYYSKGLEKLMTAQGAENKTPSAAATTKQKKN